MVGEIDLLPLAREELIPRQERARELRIVGRQPLIRVVERVAREQMVRGAGVVIEAALHEVLIDRLIEIEGVRRDPLAHGRPVRARIRVEVRPHEGMHPNRDELRRVRGVRQQALAGVVVGDERGHRLAKLLPQSPSYPAKKKRRSVLSGPPTLAPNWWRQKSGWSGPSKKLRASSASLRWNS